MLSPLSWLTLGLATIVVAQEGGSIVEVGDSLVSAMMMFVGNQDKVYILDKAEGNAAQIAGHPAWAAMWDINTRTATLMDVMSNTFCASGAALANGSYITLGGNGAITVGGNIGSVKNPQGSGAFDATYQDYDGTKAIRILNPCTDSQNFNSPTCQWFDNAAVLSMQKQRWYSTAETLADGTVVIIGGFVNGGYVNRNMPNVDPTFEGGAAEPTYEYFPSRGQAQMMKFMTTTSGLNSYPLTWLMPSGHLFVQANLSTILWNHTANIETPLPDMPNNVVRVYPASGAHAMLPLTPQNNYTPTIVFCGGSDMPADDYGNYSWPVINTWLYPASQDCQRITPEPQDGSAPVYTQDDNMLQGRTMGQFIILPDQTLLVVNGGVNGTAGYAQQTGMTPLGQMPYGESLASGPVLQPAIYNPNKPPGQRWSNAGLSTSNVPRLYHSSAILLPDGSVMLAGSNPNIDVNLTAPYVTTYKVEYFYPSYFSANTRPQPTGIPTSLSYGGQPFDIQLPPNSYSGSSNDAAANTTVMVLRQGFTTHGMNMGQRALQLNNTYTVNADGSLTIHTAQVPPNPNLMAPGPAFLYVVVNGVPSNGTYVIVGNGQTGTQPTSSVIPLPASVQLSSASGTAGGNNGKSTSGASHTGLIIGVIAGAVAVIGILGALFGICLARRRRAAATVPPRSTEYQMRDAAGAGAATGVMGPRDLRNSDSSAFTPLQNNSSTAWNASTTHLTSPTSPYKDEFPGTHSERSSGVEYDPYSASTPRVHSPTVGRPRWDGNGPMYEGPKY